MSFCVHLDGQCIGDGYVRINDSVPGKKIVSSTCCKDELHLNEKYMHDKEEIVLRKHPTSVRFLKGKPKHPWQSVGSKRLTCAIFFESFWFAVSKGIGRIPQTKTTQYCPIPISPRDSEKTLFCRLVEVWIRQHTRWWEPTNEVCRQKYLENNFDEAVCTLLCEQHDRSNWNGCPYCSLWGLGSGTSGSVTKKLMLLTPGFPLRVCPFAMASQIQRHKQTRKSAFEFWTIEPKKLVGVPSCWIHRKEVGSLFGGDIILQGFVQTCVEVH